MLKKLLNKYRMCFVDSFDNDNESIVISLLILDLILSFTFIILCLMSKSFLFLFSYIMLRLAIFMFNLFFVTKWINKNKFNENSHYQNFINSVSPFGCLTSFIFSFIFDNISKVVKQINNFGKEEEKEESFPETYRK